MDHFGACPKDVYSFSWSKKLQILFFGFFKSLMAAAFLLFVDSKVLTLLLLSTSYFFPSLKHGSLSPFLLSSSHFFPPTRASYSLLFALSFFVLFWSYPQNCWCWTPYIKKKSIQFYKCGKKKILEITYFTLNYDYYYYLSQSFFPQSFFPQNSQNSPHKKKKKQSHNSDQII